MRRLAFAELFAFCDMHASRIRGYAWNRPLYFDRQGFPLPSDGVEPAVLAFARLLENREYAVLAQDELPDGSLLSTVWLGLDHGLGGPPLIFETQRFGHRRKRRRASLEFPEPRTGDPVSCLRYASEEQALAAHHEIVRRLRVRLGH